MTAKVYPVFEVSPYTTGSVLTSPPAPPSSSPMVSFPPPAPTFSPPGAPASLDGLVLTFLLLPVPDGMVIVPVLAPDDSSSLPERLSWGEKRPCAVSSSRDLSLCPFAVSNAPSDTEVYPVGNGHAAGLPLSYDILRAYEYSCCGSCLWITADSPQVA